MRFHCTVHAKAMQLLGLRRQLGDPRLTDMEKKRLQEEITAIENALGLRDPNEPSPAVPTR